MRIQTLFLLSLLSCLMPFSADAASDSDPWPMTGVNLAGMEFGYAFFPDDKEAAYYASRGMKIVRLPVKWEYLQPVLGKPFDRKFLADMKKSVRSMESRGLVSIIDIHNYGKYSRRVKISGALARGQKIVTHTDTSGMVKGAYIAGEGIAGGTKIVSIDSATQFTMSTPASRSSLRAMLLWSIGGQPINSKDGPAYGEFADLWSRIASDPDFKSNPMVMFDLMNEPAGVDAGTMGKAAQAAIYAIRDAGADNWIMVEGGGSYANCQEFVSSGWGDVALTLTDPKDRLIYQCHEYLDRDNSGTHDTAIKGSGSTQLENATEWARVNGKKLFLGEFGIGNTPSGLRESEDMLAYMQGNNDVWAGWTAWGGGPAWPDDYIFKLEPRLHTGQTSYTDAPQMKLLIKYKDLGH